MGALYVRCHARPLVQDWTRVTTLVLIIIILLVTAIEGWTLADVLAVIAAGAAAGASAAPGGRGTAS
jgi:hypothetical protein